MAAAGSIRAGKAFVEIFADNNPLVRGLKQAENHLKQWGSTVRNAGLKMAAAGGAILAPLYKGATAFGDFEKQMRMVSTQLSDSGRWMDKYSSGIRKLAVDVGEGTDTLSKGLYDILSASIDPAKAMDVLTVATKAAKGGATDTATAVDGLTSVLNAYQLSADEAARVSDVMFASVLRGKMEFPDLAANIGKVAPMAKIAGMAIEDMMAAIATMTRQGLSTEEATVRLSNILRQAPMAAGDILGLAKKYAGADLSAILKDFPEQRAAGGIATLAGDIEGLTKDLSLMRASAGMSEDAFRKMTGGISDSFDKAKASVNDLFIAIGSALAPTLVDAISWFRQAVKSVGDWISQNKEAVVIALELGAALVSAGVALVVFGSTIRNVGSVLGLLRIGISLALGSLALVGSLVMALLSPIGLVVAGIMALGAAVFAAEGGLSRALKNLGKFFGQLKDDAVAAFDGISKALAAGDIAQAMKILWATLKMWFEAGVLELKRIWLDFCGSFEQLAYDAWHALLIGGEGAFTVLERLWISATNFLSDVWHSFIDDIMAAWNWVGSKLSKAWSWMKSQFSDSFDLEAANAEAEEYYQKQKSEIRKEAIVRESAHKREMDLAVHMHEATMTQIGVENRAKSEAIQEEINKKLAANRKVIAGLRAELKAAIDTTKNEMAGLEGGPLDPRTWTPLASTLKPGAASGAGKTTITPPVDRTKQTFQPIVDEYEKGAKAIQDALQITEGTVDDQLKAMEDELQLAAESWKKMKEAAVAAGSTDTTYLDAQRDKVVALRQEVGKLKAAEAQLTAARDIATSAQTYKLQGGGVNVNEDTRSRLTQLYNQSAWQQRPAAAGAAMGGMTGFDVQSDQVTKLRADIAALQTPMQAFIGQLQAIPPLWQQIGNLMYDTLNTITSGVGNMVAQAIIYQQDLGEMGLALLKQIGAQVIASLIQIGLQQIITAIIGTAAFAGELVGKMGGYAALTYAAAFSSIAAIPIIGPALAPAAAAGAVSAMLAGAATSKGLGTAVGAGMAGYEKGGISVSPQLAKVSERGHPEIHLTRPNIKRFFPELMGGGGMTQVIEFKVGERVIARAAVHGAPRYLRLHGIG